MLNIFNFCNKDDIRDFCQKPFNHSGYTVATCGTAIIFSPLEAEFSENTTYDVSSILSRISKQIDTDLFDDIDKELYELVCPFCHNSNGVLYDEDYKCNSCDSGTLKYYKIDGRFFNKKYIDLISHPETRISKAIEFESEGGLERGGLFFRNKEQFGFIMRLRNDPAKF